MTATPDDNPLEEHHHFLADTNRLQAFARAVARVIRPGDVVLDLGAGTGILGLLACRAGAGCVYSIEVGGMIELARRLGQANGFGERMHFIKGLSTHVELPERVDAIVTDQIGHFGYQAGLLQYVPDARRRFLKPGGRIIPARVHLQVAPVTGNDLFENVAFWERPILGFDMSPVRQYAAGTPYMMKFQAEHVLGPVLTVASIDLAQAEPTPLRLEAELTFDRAGTLHGIGGWFLAELAPDVFMTNSPLAQESIGRMNSYFPIERPVAVRAGDRLRLDMSIRPLEMMTSWTVVVVQQGREERFQHSTLQGMIVSREEVAKNRPDFVPRLSPWAEARRTILELCDGQRTLREIQDAVARRHAGLFRAPGEAAQFIAECIARYT